MTKRSALTVLHTGRIRVIMKFTNTWTFGGIKEEERREQGCRNSATEGRRVCTVYGRVSFND